MAYLRQAGCAFPVEPVTFKDHDNAVSFGDESHDAYYPSTGSNERWPTFGRRNSKAPQQLTLLPKRRLTRELQSTNTKASSLHQSMIDDEFDSFLMSGLQELRMKILQHHRAILETSRASLRDSSMPYSSAEEDQFGNSPTFNPIDAKALDENSNIPVVASVSGPSSDKTPTSHGSLSPTSRNRTTQARTSTKSVKFGSSAEVKNRSVSSPVGSPSRDPLVPTRSTATQRSKKSANGTSLIKFNVRQEWLPQAICRDPLALQQSLVGSETPDWCSAPSISTEKKQLGNSWSADLQRSEGKRWRFMLHPRSALCLIWLLMSLLFLSYDGVMVPIDVCFAMNSDIYEWTQFWARLYWTLDIVLRFMTGIIINGEVEMNPKIVFLAYIRGWFIFDLSLVAFEWFMIALSTLGEASLLSLLRSVRWLRMLRILRVLRFLRFSQVNSRLHELMVLSTDDLNMTKKLLQAVGYYLIFLHLATCTWYLLGDAIDGGWVSANHLHDTSVFYRYSVSLHSILARLRGSIRPNMRFVSRPSAEISAECAMIFLCWLVSCWFMAIVLQVVLAWAASDTAQNYRLAKSFMSRHRISRVANQKTFKFLQANQVQGPGEIMMEEARLMSILPPHLQHDLLYEVRAPLLCTMSVFWNLHVVCPRCVRHLCHEALFDQLVVEGETVFGDGDACSRMYVVRSGKFKYSPEDKSVLSNTPRQSFLPQHKSHMPSKNDEYDVCLRGQLISEAALWTFWEHMGELSAMTDGLLMNLECATFCSVISQHKMACVFACKYARHFTWSLNRSQYCDLTGFDFTLPKLDQSFGAGHDHFIFITHYKMEAGTEATLMRDLLEPMIRMDSSIEAGYLRSPIFIDSEDLADLTTLKKHVERSDNLIVLLTPDVLSRPYCLLELVTAHRAGVQLVPVEVQRPGMKYQYPSPEFYKKLRKGKVIGSEGVHLLKQEGCSLREVEEAISMLFLKIALPFSPHKSNNVRQAELADILSRCQIGAQPVNRSSVAETLMHNQSNFNFAAFGLESADENGGLEEFSMTLAPYHEET